MALSRRTLLKGSAALTAVAAVETSGAVNITTANAATPNTTSAAPPAQVPTATVTPSPEIIALNHMAFGPRPGDVDAVKQIGLAAYIEQQLNPGGIDDSACDTRLAAARRKIRYGNAPAIYELRPLDYVYPTPWSQEDLWANRIAPAGLPFQERTRPAEEVRVATWLRAVYSKRQLQEVLVDFWHNHFNVNVASDEKIAATFPAYDAIMRRNCLGNFRVFIEEVAKSVAMMYYLDNVSNRDSGGEGANENYARELFELHTLGSDNYLKFYSNREGVGSIDYKGTKFVRGYVDEDVYAAANCFTGWTIAYGGWEGRPNTGAFMFKQDWHDFGPKIVLSIDGRATVKGAVPNGDDARQVLSALVWHPGTARHICTKLCRRLMSDNPPVAVVDAAVDAWMQYVNDPDQLRKVVRAILTSNEFKTIWGQKVKRPFEMVISYLRATEAELPIDEIDLLDTGKGDYWGGLFYNYAFAGQKLFEWATPTGYPDLASYWVTTNGLLRRWNLPYVLAQPWGGKVQFNFRAVTDQFVPGGSCEQIVDFWIARLCGYTIDPPVRTALVYFLAQQGRLNEPPRPQLEEDKNDPNVITERINAMVQLLAASPDFLTR